MYTSPEHWVVYEKESTRLVPGYGYDYGSKRYAERVKAHYQRKYPDVELAVAEHGDFFANIEKQVERVNLMTGEKFTEGVNTPIFCSPAFESYWSM